MRNFLKSSSGRILSGWMLPLGLLVLPACILNSGPYEGDDGTETPLVFDPGNDPLSGAIMCDIPKVLAPEDECAKDEELSSGIKLTQAAIALAEGDSFSLAFDYSPSAVGSCSNGNPKKIEYHNGFPEGSHICLNCETQIGSVYVDAAAACVAKCVDLTNLDGKEPPGGAQSWCEQNAKVSTNFKEQCYPGACSDGGTPKQPFNDPRRQQELVKWVSLGGNAGVVMNSLSKTDETNGNVDDWDTGAAALQVISRGDAWVEFEATENTTSHVIGLTSGAGPDTNVDLADITFALSLNRDGLVYVLENGAAIITPVMIGADQLTYAPGDRFRIRIEDNHDDTAKITFTKISDPNSCEDGKKCPDFQIAGQTLPNPSYPLRIHATFREAGATLANVKMVRIQEKELEMP